MLYILQIIQWLRGSGHDWDDYLKTMTIDSETYGKGLTKNSTTWKTILRQGISKGLIEIEFTENRFHGCPRIYRKYSVSKTGQEFVGSPREVIVKNPTCRTVTIATPRTESRSKGKVAKQFLPFLRSKLASQSNWVQMESPDDYMYPGFGKAPNKLTYCENVAIFLGRSDSQDIFIKDCELSSTQTHSTPQKIVIDGVQTDVIVKRSVCVGVKVCGAQNCNYTVSTAQRINRCKLHGGTHRLEKSGECPVNIFSVKPKQNDDQRRWIGILTLLDDLVHNHAKPSPRKLPGTVVKDLKEAVLLDPSKKAKDLQKGGKKLERFL